MYHTAVEYKNFDLDAFFIIYLFQVLINGNPRITVFNQKYYCISLNNSFIGRTLKVLKLFKIKKEPSKVRLYRHM